jgi:hypothetical protein
MRGTGNPIIQALALALLLLAAACQPHRSPEARSWRSQIKPHAVTPEEVNEDPEVAARKAIAAQDWRLIQLPFAQQRFAGLVCSVPREVQDLTTISYFTGREDVASPGEGPRRKMPSRIDPAALARFNRAIAANPASPWLGLCVAAEAWRGAVDPKPWSLIGPIPSDPPRDLLTTARLGLPDTRNFARHDYWDGDRRDLFGMTALSWAVVRADRRRVAWMVRPPVDDFRNWCLLARQRDRIPPAWQATDPLVLAVNRRDFDLISTLLPVRSERRCAQEGHFDSRRESESHPLFQAAWQSALSSGDEALVTALLPDHAMVDEPAKARLAEELRRKGFDRLAADTWFAPVKPEHSPFAAAAETCSPEGVRFWLRESRARRRDAEIAYAWETFSTRAEWQPRRDCLEVLRIFVGDGRKLPSGSPLLAAAVEGDVVRSSNRADPDPGAATSADEAAELVALFRRAGGDPNAPVRARCPRRLVGEAPLFCTPGEIAATGRTVYAALLARPRPLADQLIHDAANDPELSQPFETPIEEARRSNCLAALDDPLARQKVQSCLDRRGTPLIVERAVQAGG